MEEAGEALGTPASRLGGNHEAIQFREVVCFVWAMQRCRHRTTVFSANFETIDPDGHLAHDVTVRGTLLSEPVRRTVTYPSYLQG